jgi:hypothetical protein
MEPQVILELGSEFGSVTLSGMRGSQGWRFCIESVDQSAAMLDEEDLKGPPLFGKREIRHVTEWVDSWEDALALLDKYPWHRFYPLAAHPEFAQRVWNAVKTRFERDPSEDELPHNIQRWRYLSGAP